MKLTSHIKREKKIEGVQAQGAEEDALTSNGGRYRLLEKSA
jgi:hypothetical protein